MMFSRHFEHLNDQFAMFFLEHTITGWGRGHGYEPTPIYPPHAPSILSFPPQFFLGWWNFGGNDDLKPMGVFGTSFWPVSVPV